MSPSFICLSMILNLYLSIRWNVTIVAIFFLCFMPGSMDQQRLRKFTGLQEDSRPNQIVAMARGHESIGM